MSPARERRRRGRRRDLGWRDELNVARKVKPGPYRQELSPDTRPGRLPPSQSRTGVLHSAGQGQLREFLVREPNPDLLGRKDRAKADERATAVDCGHDRPTRDDVDREILDDRFARARCAPIVVGETKDVAMVLVVRYGTDSSREYTTVGVSMSLTASDTASPLNRKASFSGHCTRLLPTTRPRPIGPFSVRWNAQVAIALHEVASPDRVFRLKPTRQDSPSGRRWRRR